MLQFKSFFPHSHQRNVRLFYLINAGFSVWLIEAVWYFYWARFTDYETIGLLFAILTFVWIVMEIPTGVIADLFGRKKAVIMGCVCLTIGSISAAFATHFSFLIVSGIFANIGRAFISGSLEALLFDDLKSRGVEQYYDEIIAANSRIELFVYALSILLGGWLYLLHFRLAHIMTVVVDLFILIAATRLIEKSPIQTRVLRFRDYILQNLNGFRQLAKPSLRPYIMPILVVMVLYFFYDWGLSKPAMALGYGYGVQGQAIIFTLMAIISAWFVGTLPWIRKKMGDVKGLWLLQLLLGVVFVFSGLPWGFLGFGILLVIELVGALIDPYASIVINRHIDSAHRATTLSSMEFLAKIPFIWLVWQAGTQIQQNTLDDLHLGLGIAVLGSAFVYWLYQLLNRTMRVVEK